MLRRSLLAAGASALAAHRLRLPISRLPFDRPRPTPAQLRWQREELAMFLHFGMNTFTDREWGDGTEDPRRFNPDALDARSWAGIATRAGFGSMILTAKHHDGFCLWPTATTDHSVRSSPWRGGQGDVVRDFTAACAAEGLGAGVYLSPWDRNAKSYGDSAAYNDFYVAQLTELLTRYGPIVEVWFDGANGEGPNGRKQQYDWPRIWSTVRRLQPGAVMFSDAGPDVRWIGNERGVAGDTCWSTIDPAAVPYPGYDAPGVPEHLQRGDPDGSVWRPGETDVSIRPGWFWHPAESDRVRSGGNLLELYFTSVGRNSKLLLNVPPDRRGRLDPVDVSRLQAFASARVSLLERDLARGAHATAESYVPGHPPSAVLDRDPDTFWTPRAPATHGSLRLELPGDTRFDTIALREPVEQGQTVAGFTVSAEAGGRWQPIAAGTTIGCLRLLRTPAATARRVRLDISAAEGAPRLSTFSLYRSDG